MKRIVILILLINQIITISANAQVAINTDGSSPDASAMLEVKSTNKGFLPPVMSELQMNAIVTPAEGLIVYCTDCTPKGPYYFDGNVFLNFSTNFMNFSYLINPTTGHKWMDRNLGATQVATSSTDAAAYGDLYQWGRDTDGHQIRTSATYTTLSSTDTPGHGYFILGLSSPFDWRSPQNDNLWQRGSGINNPCPSGYRIPTEAEITAEMSTWSTLDAAGAFASPLKFTAAGFRFHLNGAFYYVGESGAYWSSTVDGIDSRDLGFSSSSAGMYSSSRTDGFSVRCIEEGTTTVPDAPTIGTATAGDKEAFVPFTQPASDGGSTITSYTATSSPSGITGTLTQAGSGTITVTGLSNGTAYTFTVTATNANGTGAPSAASNSVTPVVQNVTNPTTGEIWMDRNLGATQVATSSTDTLSYGDLYQWGRLTDGHQIKTSYLTTTSSSTDVPGHDDFIDGDNTGWPYDWRKPQNDNLWQGVGGINNPCPSGYRLPTEAELDAERASWSSNNSAGAFASPLKFTVAGYRSWTWGVIHDVGSDGSYWSSTVDDEDSHRLTFSISNARMSSTARANGFSVRCIKE